MNPLIVGGIMAGIAYLTSRKGCDQDCRCTDPDSPYGPDDNLFPKRGPKLEIAPQYSAKKKSSDHLYEKKREVVHPLFHSWEL
jgi:hypothetical protein